MAKIKAKVREISTKTVRPRDNSLDYLRGIAVFLMVFAHVIHFLGTNDSNILRFIEGAGNTVCFTLFFFVSGTVSYLAYLKEKVDFKNKIPAILRRIAYMLLGYYLIAFSAQFSEFSWPPNEEWIPTALNILSFRNVPGFTEFIIPFILISVLLLALFPIFKLAAKHLPVIIGMSVGLFLIGSFLFTKPVSNVLTPYKALFVGNFEYYRFPLLQYMPVFLFGLTWGHIVVNTTEDRIKEKLGIKYGIAFVLTFGISEIVSSYFHIPYIEPLNRWPPSIGFLSIGLAFAFFSIPIIINLLKVKILDPVNRFFIYIGQDAFDIFIFSTFLLFLYRQILNYHFSEIQYVFAGLFVTFGLSMLLASFNSFQSASLFRKGTDIVTKKQKLFRKRYMILAILMMAIVFSNLKIPVYSDVAGAIITPNDIEEYAPINPDDKIPWWDSEYGFYKQVTIDNIHPFKSIGAKSYVEIQFNHAQLVEDGKSLPDGSDLKVLYYTGDSYLEVPYIPIDINSSKTVLQTQVISRIYPQKTSNRYFIFYGKDFAEESTIGKKKSITNEEYKVTLGKEQAHPVSSRLSKKWVLKSKTISSSDALTLTVTLGDTELSNADVKYNIVGVSEQDVTMSQVSPMVYQSKIAASELKVGEYKIQVFAEIENETVLGQVVSFDVTYPLYVSWTVDWEGSNESDAYLRQLANISDEHNAPITHFFNPRIYLETALDKARSQELTKWVMERNESIQLHLHMHKDLVEAAGVEYRESPRWSKFTDMGDGYDVPTTEYSYEEVYKIISWGASKLEEKGLGKPTMYRAGGWFVDKDVLKTLDKLGFEVDSSGRVAEQWWEKYSSVWNLKDTTQPYQPSLENQNSSKAPTYNLWEFPNNGGDSTSYEAAELIENFKNNWDGEPLKEKKIITYLSHPKWFDIDGPRMDALFDYIDQYLFENDDGPVVYTDLENAYLEWTAE